MAESNKDEVIVFRAYMPPIKSAFQADNDEVRIVLAIPAKYRAQGLQMASMFDKQLDVMIKEV